MAELLDSRFNYCGIQQPRFCTWAGPHLWFIAQRTEAANGLRLRVVFGECCLLERPAAVWYPGPPFEVDIGQGSVPDAAAIRGCQNVPGVSSATKLAPSCPLRLVNV